MPIPDRLQAAIRDGKLIPFAGAGVSMSVARKDGGRLLPSWSDLLHNAADRLRRSGNESKANAVAALTDDNDFLLAASKAKEALGADWPRFLVGELDVPSDLIDPNTLVLPQTLWKLASPVVITTNFDRVLRRANPDPGDLTTWDIEAPAGLSALLDGTARRQTLWCLHGTLDDSVNIILTPGGFGQLYGSAAVEPLYTAAQATLRSLLLSHTFLFVGFSFDDQAVRSELEAMAKTMKGTAGPHFAIVRQHDAAKIRALGLPVELLIIDDFGLPMITLLNEMVAIREAAPPPGTPSPGAEFNPKNRAFHLPFRAKGDQVVGRADALEAVRRQLESGTRTRIGQTAAFQGMGGLGKTQLAVEYAAAYEHLYPSGVIWLTADGDIASQLIEVADLAKWVSAKSDHSVKLDIATQRVRTFDGGLVIFDNVESMEDIQPYFPLPSAAPHLLLTSRLAFPDFETVPLDTLSLDESFQLLVQEARKHPSGQEQEAARRIAARLSGLPLALELAGAFVRHSGATFEEYESLLAADPTGALRVSDLPSFTGHDADIAAALAVHERLTQQEPALRDVLDVLTWSASTPMSVSLLNGLLPQIDRVTLQRILGLGERLRFLQRVPDEPRYSIHRLLAEVRRRREPFASTWAEEIARRIATWFRERRVDISYLTDYERDANHLEAWQQNVQVSNTNLAVELAWLQAYPPYHRGQVTLAADIVYRAMKAFKPGNDWIELQAHILHDRGTTQNNLGQYEEALVVNIEALEIRQNVLGKQHPDTATSLDGVGSTLHNLGRYAEALVYKEEGLAIRRDVLGERHPDTPRSLGSVSATLHALGQYDESLARAEEALAIRRGLLGERHPDTATSLDSVGATLNNLERYAEALTRKEEALAIRRDVLGERHPDSARSLDSVSATLHNLGRYPESLAYAEEALAIRRNLLGERHPETASSLESVAKTLNNIGRHPTAQRYAKEALDVLAASLGMAHPRTIEALATLVRTLAVQGHTQAAQQLIVRHMKQVGQSTSSYMILKELRAEIGLSTSREKLGPVQRKPRRRR